MAKKLSKTQKARKRVRKRTKKLELANNTTKVSVNKETNLVATINANGISSKKNNSSTSAEETANKKKNYYKNQNIKKKNTANVDLPKLKDGKTKEIKKDIELPKEKEEEKKEVVKKEETSKISLPKLKDKKEETIKEEKKKDKKEEKIVEATYEDKKTKKEKDKEKEEEKRRLVENTQVLYNIFVSDYMKQNKKLGKKKVKKIYDYEEDDDFEENLPRKKSKYFIVNAFFFCKDNMYLLYNTILGLLFIFLMIGLIEVHNFTNNFIAYVGCLLGFLVLVAMSYNKYFSGRILTILLCTGMIFAIFKLQYNYDFLDSLDHRNYESRTYYIVTFDNKLTTKIYGLNGKKVGILTDNKTNIERKLNIKVDGINYQEYNDFQEMINVFYRQEMRAVIVTPNQYKYLSNSEDKYGRKVKVLYTFEAISLK